MNLSKGEIDRLGNLIREETGALSESTINRLQEYRTSHKEALSEIFRIICTVTPRVKGRSIVTYRIKRFQSIISKLNRIPEMRFSRMGDIGGCRCILETDEEVFKLKSVLEGKLNIIKVNDYITNPREDGYRSLHLYVNLPNDSTLIEIQLRNISDHNWATLVEITDLLFDTKLKEYGDHTEFSRFHYLLSIVDDLTIQERKEIIKIIYKHKYVEKLSGVFARNYIQVRKQWLNIQNKTTHKYFLIESNKDDVPSIESFRNFNEAELNYFNLYKTRPDANAVLTHLPFPSYNQIGIAYSNYILTFHDFLNDCDRIHESLIIDSLEIGKILDFRRFLDRYNEMAYNRLRILVEEANEVNSIIKRSKKSKIKSKEKEWATDLNNQIKSIYDDSRKFRSKFQTILPSKGFKRILIALIVRRATNKYRRNVRKLNLSK